MILKKEVAERERVEAALRESEERYRGLVELSPDAIIVHRSGKFVFANAQAAELFGMASPGELIGKNIIDFRPPDEVEGTRARFQRIEYEEGKTYILLERRIIRPDGTAVDVDVKGRPFTHHGKQAVQAVIRDITERKRAEDVMRETRRMAAIGELSAGVAHELNNPLGSIMIFAELLLSDSLSEPVRDDVEKIHQEAQRAARIVRGLLSFSRNHKPEKRYIDLMDVAKQAMELKAHDFRTENIEATLERSEQVPFTLADEYQMVDVLVNILTNAGQAMADAHGRGRLIVRAEKSDGRIRIVISDDGPGIAAGHLGKIFDPFFSTKEQGKGTGLGLSHGIVSQHGGRLWAESRVGEGATFYIELPILGPDGRLEPQPAP